MAWIVNRDCRLQRSFSKTSHIIKNNISSYKVNYFTNNNTYNINLLFFISSLPLQLCRRYNKICSSKIEPNYWGIIHHRVSYTICISDINELKKWVVSWKVIYNSNHKVRALYVKFPFFFHCFFFSVRH